MIWLWIAAAVLLGVLLAAALVGALLPREHTASCTIELHAAPDSVFAALSDWRALPAWRTDLTAVEELPGGNGWIETGRWGRLPIRVERCEAPRVLVTRIADDSLPYGGAWTWSLEPTSLGGTRVTTTENGFVRPPLFRCLSRFVFGHHRTLRAVQRALAAKFGEDTEPRAR